MAMQQLHPSKYRMPLACAYLIAGSLALAGCGGTQAQKPQATPDNLRPPAGALLTLQTHAKGVQIYQCHAGAAPGAVPYEWTLKAPEAVLFDQTGAKIARHYAGPTWESSDGSLVVGEVVSRADSPDAQSIPWLLLRAKSVSGRGRFGAVKFIQRVHTSGGSAPTSCTVDKVGKELRVNYTADYYFYVESRT
jgi:Protein of unknown function (DUF3455)